MKSTILKYGIYGFLAGLVFFALSFLFGKNLDFSTQEIIGYLSIIVSLSFIYFAIKHYRDKVNNGLVSFKKTLGIGVLVSVFVAIGIAISDYIYTSFLNPDFMTEYVNHTLKGMKETLSESEFKAEKAILLEEVKMWDNPIIMALFMFVNVIIIGFVISLISGLILQRK